MTAPRLVLAVLIIVAALGAFLRWSPRVMQPQREAKIAVPAKQRVRGLLVGGFLVEAAGDRELQSLRLRAPNCRWPIFVTAAHVFGAAAEKLIAIRYPTSWRTFYVYHGQISEKFTRSAALREFLIGRVRAQVTLQPLDPVDMVYLTFHASDKCDLEPAALTEASRGLIALMTHAPG